MCCDCATHRGVIARSGCAARAGPHQTTDAPELHLLWKHSSQSRKMQRRRLSSRRLPKDVQPCWRCRALSRQCSTMQHGHVGVAGGSPLQSPSGVRIMDPARHSSPRADFFSTSIRTEAYELQRNWARKVFSISIANLISTKSHQGVFRPLKGGRQHSLEMYLVAELGPAGPEAVCK